MYTSDSGKANSPHRHKGHIDSFTQIKKDKGYLNKYYVYHEPLSKTGKRSLRDFTEAFFETFALLFVALK
jgi:hypothetical protein